MIIIGIITKSFIKKGFEKIVEQTENYNLYSPHIIVVAK
jgi:hypothetical protein